MSPCILKFKSNVRVPRTTIIAVAFLNACNALSLDQEVWVTSGNDSAHMKGSKHYTDEALDFRTKTMIAGDKARIVAEVKHRLGRDYDVVFEDEGGANEHLHIEFDPK